MIVRRFLLWARSAPPGHRAEAIGSLAKAYLYSDLPPEHRAEAEIALTAMLDDPSPLVRRAMAESLARATDAPRHVILALAWDQSEVAEMVLARSPVLADADLIDAVALGDERAQVAIASRPCLTPGVAGAIAAVACPEALVALCRNHDAEVAPASFRIMVERHAKDASLRDALLGRPDLPVDVAQTIAEAVAEALAAFVTGCGWLSAKRSERATREACEQASLLLSARSDPGDVTTLVKHMRHSAQLTPALLLRALLSGQHRFLAAAFQELTGLPERRVVGILRHPSGRPFVVLFAKAGLPDALRSAFQGGLEALGQDRAGAQATRLSRRVVAGALAACAELPAEESTRIVGLLRRLEAEAARDEAREAAATLADDAALDLVLRYAPEQLSHATDAALAA